MAGYTKTVIKGKIINTLRYRGSQFMETWIKDGLLEQKGKDIATQVKEVFCGDIEKKEFELILRLDGLDCELEETISKLTEYEEKYKVGGVAWKMINGI